MLLIVSSLKDRASAHIRQRLLALVSHEDAGPEFLGEKVLRLRSDRFRTSIPAYLATNPEDTHLGEDHLPERFEEAISGEIPEQGGPPRVLSCIYLSRHSSQSGARTLTVHPIGNYGEASFGGRAGVLVPCDPYMVSLLLRGLERHSGKAEGFVVNFEVTHHGPYSDRPVCFIEVGSDETAYADEGAATAVASAVVDGVATWSEGFTSPGGLPERYGPMLVGIGGGHYAPRHTDVALSRNGVFGHMVPTYQLATDDGVDRSGNLVKVNKALAATVEPSSWSRSDGGNGDEPPLMASKVYLHRKQLKRGLKGDMTEGMAEMGVTIVSSGSLDELRNDA